MTLRARIAAIAGISVALAVAAAALGLYLGVRSDLRGEIDSQLRTRAQAIAGRLGAASAGGYGGEGLRGPQAPVGGPFGGPPVGLPGTVAPARFGAATGFVEYVASDGGVFVPHGQSGGAPVPLQAAGRRIASSGRGEAFAEETVAGTRLRVLVEGLGSDGAVLVARPLTEVEHELSNLVLILALIGGGGVLLAAALGALVARTALSPIGEFTRRTEELSGALDLSRRLEVRGRDELARLADSFNGTLAALERAVHAQRQLIADASHELRTPLASLRANIQLLSEVERLPQQEQEALRADIVAELDQLTALVSDVVELARGSEPDAEGDEVRLDEVLAATVQSARRRGGARLELELEPTLVHGPAERIARAVSNVIDNARKWSPQDAVVEVRLRDGVLEVRDHGPGFDERDLPHVFARFYRAPAARGMPGSGLGLAIVRQAAEACGGFAEAANAPGGGALVRVSFGTPLAFGQAPGRSPTTSV